MRLVKVLIALPMILLFGILRLFATAISWLYCRAASLLFVPMIILLILSVIATQWLAVGIIGAAVVVCFILLFTIGWIFEKRHDNVVRDIRNLDCSEEFRLLNFEESSYTNLQGHRQACFNMTRDGFVFLVMGYRGKKAASFKEAYIKRFLYSVRSHSL